MNKRDRNGNSSPVATVLRDGQTVSTTAYQWAVAVLSPELSVQEHWCAAPMCRAACTLPRIWSQWVFDVPQQPPYMSMCRCCRASPTMTHRASPGRPPRTGVQSELVIIAALGRRRRTFPNHLPGWIAGMNSHGYEQLMP
jgi:hypothetical protein